MGVMEVIARGLAGGGLSNNARKRDLREVLTIRNKKWKSERFGAGQVISFSEDDYPEGFDRQHDDPMVITATIHNYSIKQILVN